MNVTPGVQRYDVILAGKYYLRELVEAITLEESLDEIAYRASIQLVHEAVPTVVPAQSIKIVGTPFGGTGTVTLFDGVVWEVESLTRGKRRLNITAYDRTIYLSRSEDEYLFPAGQTATQRIKKYAADWGIKLFSLADTKVPLEKAIYRSRPIYSMMLDDLRETVRKGGGMYRTRMAPTGLELFEIGTNKTVWVLESSRNVEEISHNQTLEGAVTQVKVLGKESEGKRTPVLALVKGETAKYGTVQKIYQDDKVKTAAQAKKAGQELLSGPQETVTVRMIDINTIRAGDKVKLDQRELIVASVMHELGSPGHMMLELMPTWMIRRRYYAQ